MKNDSSRLVIISPVRDEAEYLETVARSVARQSHPPHLWLVVDDGSTDGTPDMLRRLSKEIPFLRALRTPEDHTKASGDRHAVAAAPRAFNWALQTVDVDEFTHIGKLDGDIELPEDYFRLILQEFERDPKLGVAGGVLVERVGDEWRRPSVAPDHVRGALKLYRRECFEAIGGLREHLGWDGVDQVQARMHGYTTRSFDHVVARHHRACGAVNGVLRARVRGGETYYIVGFSFPWVVLKALKSGRLPPVCLSTFAFLYGYLRAAQRAIPRAGDEQYRRFLRRDQRRRVVARSVGRMYGK
jgi:poly-beta-1,6-N-acetyl-D-glucosamine synthase